MTLFNSNQESCETCQVFIQGQRKNQLREQIQKDSGKKKKVAFCFYVIESSLFNKLDTKALLTYGQWENDQTDYEGITY